MKEYDNPRKRRGTHRTRSQKAYHRKVEREKLARKKAARKESARRERVRSGRKQKKRTAADYKADLKLLRHYFTGFDKRNGFNESRLSDAAKKTIRKVAPQIAQLRALQSYPHKEVKAASKKKLDLGRIAPVQGEQISYKVKRTSGKGRKRKVKTVEVIPQPRAIPIFTTDEKAKVSLNKDGSIRVVENGHIRDVYPIDRVRFTRDPYRYMRDFIRQHRAPRVTLNVSGNVIGSVFQERDFVDSRERREREARGEIVYPAGANRFVVMVERYREKDAVRAERFIEQIGAVSVLRGGIKASNDFEKQVFAGRAALRDSRKLARVTARARATGRR